MKKHYILITLLFFFANSFSQSIESINEHLNLSNQLSEFRELRIYKKYSTTNGSEIFRLFRTKNGIWSAELYKYYDAVEGATELHIESINLKPKTDLNLVWLYLLDSKIDYLPNIDNIKYKFRSKGKIIIDEGEYNILWKLKTSIDGIGYQAFFKDGDKVNSYVFDNYKSYKVDFPDIDELNYYSEIMEIIKNEFEIWDK